jgi:radical SAM protein with 4Fe4S-binding SPASM domain
MVIRGAERYLARIVATTNGEPIAIEDCHPATEFLFISAQGRISPCSFSSDAYGVPIAEVGTAEEFLQLPVRFREIRRRNRISACNDCHATHVFDKFQDQSKLQLAEIQAAT